MTYNNINDILIRETDNCNCLIFRTSSALYNKLKGTDDELIIIVEYVRKTMNLGDYNQIRLISIEYLKKVGYE
jgi:hypothetical protein